MLEQTTSEMQVPIKKYIKPASDAPICYGENLQEEVQKQLATRHTYRKAVFGLLENLPPLLSNPKTRLGIEIEVENMVGHIDKWKFPPWSVKGDGSLRNQGVEFVSAAIFPKDVRLSLAMLYAWFPHYKTEPDFSWRTSTHVHLETSHLTGDQFKRLLLLYLVFEDVLFEFARPGRRETNIFCTPLSRTDFECLRAVIQATSAKALRDALARVSKLILKYSALNINHVFGFGTIEFRHLGGEKNPEKIVNWINLLLKLFEYAEKADSKFLEDQILTLNTSSLYKTLTQLVFGNLLQEQLTFPNHDEFLANGVSLCKQLLSPAVSAKKQSVEKTGMQLFFEKGTLKSPPPNKLPLGERPLYTDQILEEPIDTDRIFVDGWGAQPAVAAFLVSAARNVGEPFRYFPLEEPAPITAWNPLGVTKMQWAENRRTRAPLGDLLEFFDLLMSRERRARPDLDEELHNRGL